MSDVRALLKAKRQEARISHPLASYTSTGQLRCIACGTIVKHASAWNGHVGSKGHRVNVARIKEEERLKALELEKVQGKRKADEEEDEEESLDGEVQVEVKKRKVSVDAEEDEDDEMDGHQTQTHQPHSAFPADFFSDPSRSLPPQPDDNDSDQDDENAQDINKINAPSTSTPNAIDLEWENFQKAMLTTTSENKQEAYERATVTAEPVLASTIPEGFPPPIHSSSNPTQPPITEGDTVEQEELTEEQLRRKKEQDERELIMDRLLDEEEAQEEADAKVVLLKSRVEALKKRREVARMAKAGKIGLKS